MRYLTFILVFWSCIFFISIEKVNAQMCLGSGTENEEQCVQNPWTESWECGSTKPVTYSCRWFNSSCSRPTKCRCVTSPTRCEFDCSSPAQSTDGCYIRQPVPTATPQPGATLPPIPPTPPPAAPTDRPQAQAWCCGNSCPGYSDSGVCIGHPWWTGGRKFVDGVGWQDGGNQCAGYSLQSDTDACWSRAYSDCQGSSGNTPVGPGGEASCPRAVNDPKGNHELSNCDVAASGWACDPDYNGPIRFRVNVNDQGVVKTIFDGLTKLDRPDVLSNGACKNLNSGFSVPMPGEYKDGISRFFWVDFPTDYAAGGVTRDISNSPKGPNNNGRNLSCSSSLICETGVTTGACQYTGMNWCAINTSCNTGVIPDPQVRVSCPVGTRIRNAGTYCHNADYSQESFNGSTDCISDVACQPTPTPACVGTINSLSYIPTIELGAAQPLEVAVNVQNCPSSSLTATPDNSNVSASSPILKSPGAYQSTLNANILGSTNIRIALLNPLGEELDSRQITISALCTAPPPPTNVRTSDAVLKVNVDWNSPSLPGNYDGYIVSRSDDGIVYPFLSGLLPKTTLTYTDTTMSCGTYYFYGVQTYNLSKPPTCRYSNVYAANATGTCTPYQDWFAARAGNIIAGAYLRSSLPPGAPNLPAGLPAAKLIDDYPGMAIGGDVSAMTGLSNGAISSKNWLVSSASVTSKNENTYPSMVERMLTKATPINFTGDISEGNYFRNLIESAGNTNTIPAAGGIVLLRHIGDMSIGNAGTVDIGPRKVILLVDGNVQINSTITHNNSGFFAVFSSGDITINPSVGELTYRDIRPNAGYANPQLMGVYYANGTFSTGAAPATCSTPPCSALQLRVDGTIIGMSGVNMQRNVKGPYPSEYVDFIPEYAYTLHLVGLRRKVFQELLNP